MIGAPLLDRDQVSKALRRLADAVDAGDVQISDFVVHNEIEMDPVDDAAVPIAVFRGQHVKFSAMSLRVIVGDA